VLQLLQRIGLCVRLCGLDLRRERMRLHRLKFRITVGRR
jgi:hypothetical protein